MSASLLRRWLPPISAAIATGNEAATVRAAQRAIREGVSAAAIYEVALQSYLFAGYPRAIIGLASVAKACTTSNKPHSRGTLKSWKRRGAVLCRRIYGASTDRMLANMRSLHPALAEWIVWEGYGKVLSRPGLEAASREACAVAALAALKAWPQLQSHARGALRVGLPAADLRRAAGTSRQAREIVRQAVADLVPTSGASSR